jgi:hypothetical protein
MHVTEICLECNGMIWWYMPVYLVGLSPEAGEVQVPLQQQTSEDMTTQQQQQNGNIKGASALMEPQMVLPVQQDNECECRITSLNILKSCARTRYSFFLDVARRRLVVTEVSGLLANGYLVNMFYCKKATINLPYATSQNREDFDCTSAHACNNAFFRDIWNTCAFVRIPQLSYNSVINNNILFNSALRHNLFCCFFLKPLMSWHCHNNLSGQILIVILCNLYGSHPVVFSTK